MAGSKRETAGAGGALEGRCTAIGWPHIQAQKLSTAKTNKAPSPTQGGAEGTENTKEKESGMRVIKGYWRGKSAGVISKVIER